MKKATIMSMVIAWNKGCAMKRWDLSPGIAVLLLAMLCTNITHAQLAGYSHVEDIYVNHDRVAGSSNLTDFPLLVSITEDYLRTTGNGGDVTNANGYDIAFSVDGTTQLAHEIEYYDGTTGEYIAWVNIPTLYYNQYTIVYLSYGNASITVDPSSTSTWNSGYVGVWHLHEEVGGTGTVDLYQDATGNGHHGDDQVSATGTEGVIGQGQQFDGANDYVDMGNVLDYGESDPMTYSAWIRTTGGWTQIAGKAFQNPPYQGIWFYIENDGGLAFYVYDDNGDLIGRWSDPVYNDDEWHYVTTTYDGSGTLGGIKLYEAGNEITTFQGTYADPLTGTVENGFSFNIGAVNDGAGDQFDGFIDEVRLSTVVRSDDWIATEYNNQSDPASFLSLGGPPVPDGPGGIGSTNGATSLVLWLDAASISGGPVSTWNDESGYGNDAPSGVAAPGYSATGGGNSQPTVTFNAGSTQNFVIDGPTHPEVIPSDAFSIFVAGNFSSTNVFGGLVTTSSLTSWADGWGFNDDNDNVLYYYTDWSAADGVGWRDFGAVDDNDHIYGMVRNSGGSANAYEDESSSSFTSASLTYNGGNDLQIGSSPGPYYLTGEISEIIQFDDALNSAERIVLANYLSAKYNIALSSNNAYAQDGNAEGDYDFDVAGIGRVDASNILDDAQGTGVVRILNADNLNNDEFLIWGHDGGTWGASETGDVPGGMLSRLVRVWRVSEANASGASVDVGAVDIRFDLRGLEPYQTSDLRLLVDTDLDGAFADETPISGATALGGGIYEFAGISDLADDRRFTVGTIDIALPIELLRFKAEVLKDGRAVGLEWSTGSETNNDFFTVERSRDSKEWSGILHIPGAGNSSSRLDYATTDNHPLHGLSYYRLKQTDFNGAISYSPVVTVSIGQINSTQPYLFPNPATDVLTVNGIVMDLRKTRIHNVLGQDVSDQVAIRIGDDTDEYRLDVSLLPPGWYSLKTDLFSLKFMKRR